MKNPHIPFGKPFIVGKELFYIAQAVMNGSISGDGEFTKRCQLWLETHLKTPKALLTHSCTAALEMSAILADVGPGDEIIMPSFTFVSTANAFALRGGIPVFVDIRPDTLNIDERLIESAITPQTKAIVAVHYAGQSCAMEALKDICDRHKLVLIEDAAQAILSQEDKKSLGTIGDLGCISFHETKNIICGEGGALLINNQSLIERAEIIWQKGTNRKAFLRGEVDKYTWTDIGSSYLPSEITAAFLFAQLEQANKINSHRRALYNEYVKLLSPLADSGTISIPYLNKSSITNAHIFYILTRTINERNALISYLRNLNISAVFHYIPLHNSPAGLRYARCNSDLPITIDIASRLLRLPLYSELSTNQVRRICKALLKFYSSHKT